MSGKAEKDFDDVGALMNQLDLGTLRYREFRAPRSAAQPVAAPVPAPAAVQPEMHVAVVAPPSPPPAASSAAPAPVEEAPQRLRAVTSGSPLAFTFERLRRQAIGTGVRTPALALDLPDRHPVRADALSLEGSRRSLADVFAGIEAVACRRNAS